MSVDSAVEDKNFELVISVRAGCARNNTISAETIHVKPVDEQGLLELYCKKFTEHIENSEEDIQFCNYELRWKPSSKDSLSSPITVPVTTEHEFIIYPEVKDVVVFVLRKKLAFSDHFPYFFWCQESDSVVYKRFMTSFDMCLQNLEKEKIQLDQIEKQKPVDLMQFLKDNEMMCVLDDIEVCKHLYQYVPESFRTPAGLKSIITSSSFKKNSQIYQSLVQGLGHETSCELYSVNLSECPPNEETLDQGIRSYLHRIEKWAKKSIEEEKEKEEKKEE